MDSSIKESSRSSYGKNQQGRKKQNFTCTEEGLQVIVKLRGVRHALHNPRSLETVRVAHHLLPGADQGSFHIKPKCKFPNMSRTHARLGGVLAAQQPLNGFTFYWEGTSVEQTGTLRWGGSFPTSIWTTPFVQPEKLTRQQIIFERGVFNFFGNHPEVQWHS